MTALHLKALPVAVLAIALGACSTKQVALQDPTIPQPLIDQLPLVVAARYPEQFEHFVHEEQVIGKKKWTIDMGRANSMLFTQLFDSMFTDFSVLGHDEDPSNRKFDALIEPSIDAFEFSVPSQSQTDAFAVWIRYRIKIFDQDGNQIANWPIAAYGKSLDLGFGGDNEALQRAAVLAMRDAAALIILQMDKATGISALSEARRSLARSPETAEGSAAGEVIRTTSSEGDRDDSG
ncbi:MAG TPA: hypothetical protein VF389_04000 [Woeseiaceae bacterium]